MSVEGDGAPERLVTLLKQVLPDSTTTVTSDSTTQFWEKYSKEAAEYDREFLEKNRNNMDIVLFFAGIFSAVAAAFLVAMQPLLSPNPTDTTNALLMMLVRSANNSALPDQSYQFPSWDGPSTAVLWSQAIGYASLSASLLTALGAVLGKQWLSDFNRVGSGTPQERGRRRQQKLDGLKKWQFELIMEIIPALIQLALLLFGVALSINLWLLHPAVGSVVIVATALGSSLYLFITFASLFFPSCPYHTRFASSFRVVAGAFMKSLGEVADYWAWRTRRDDQGAHRKPVITPVNKVLAFLPAVISSVALLAASMILIVASITCGPIITLLISILRHQSLGEVLQDIMESALAFKSRVLPITRRRFYESACLVRDTARRIRTLSRLGQEPEPDSDAHSVAWLLETSHHPDFLMTAAALVPDVHWPDDLDVSLPTQHIYSIFTRSLQELTSISQPHPDQHDRALKLGKALVILLCQKSKDVTSHVWREAQQRLQLCAERIIEPDLSFVLTIAIKLLYLKSDPDSRGLEPISNLGEIPNPVLEWFLQPLQILLQPDDSYRRHFLTEARQAFLKVQWCEDPKLPLLQQVQYCRTFETYINGIRGLNPLLTDASTHAGPREHEQDPVQIQVDILKQIAEKVTRFSVSLDSDYQDLVVPLTVLSSLMGAPHLRAAFESSDMEAWALKTFNVAVRSTSGRNDKAGWLFASSLLQLASQAHAIEMLKLTEEQKLPTNPGGGRAPTPTVSPHLVDSESLLLYLLNKVEPATADQAVYALKFIVVNDSELPSVVCRPDFIDYIVRITGPGQVYSVRDISLKTLFAACESLLRTHADDLTTLAPSCDLPRFIHRAVQFQDPPTILQYLLSQQNEVLNESILKILTPILADDPFKLLLAKLRSEPHRIPERDLRDLEIMLVLAKHEGRRKLLDHLDRSIQTVQQTRSYAMTLPFAVIVGWLLRPDGPLSASGPRRAELLRPSFEELLVPAWRDPDVLEDGPQMLRLLLIATTEWLASYQEGLPPQVALGTLGDAVEQMSNVSRMLPLDIKRALQKTSREIRDLRQRTSEQGPRLAGGERGDGS